MAAILVAFPGEERRHEIYKGWVVGSLLVCATVILFKGFIMKEGHHLFLGFSHKI